MSKNVNIASSVLFWFDNKKTLKISQVFPSYKLVQLFVPPLKFHTHLRFAYLSSHKDRLNVKYVGKHKVLPELAQWGKIKDVSTSILNQVKLNDCL